MPESYSIAMLAAVKFLDNNGFSDIDVYGFICDEGDVQIIAKQGETTHLVMAKAKRARGGLEKPTESESKLRHIAMAYLIEHPDVRALQMDIIEARIGEHATVTINSNMNAYSWER